MSFMTKSCGEGVYVSLAMNTGHAKITVTDFANDETINIAGYLVNNKEQVTCNMTSSVAFQRFVNVFCVKEHGALRVALLLPIDDLQLIQLSDIVLFLQNFPRAQDIEVSCLPLRFLKRGVAQHFVDVLGPNLVTLSMRGPCPAIGIAPYKCESEDRDVVASFEPRAGLRVERRSLATARYRATDARIDALISRLDAAPSSSFPANNCFYRR